MTDDDLRARVRRAFHADPPPGFANRVTAHGFGARVDHRTVPLRLVMVGTAAVLLVAGISARVITLHLHPTGSPTAATSHNNNRQPPAAPAALPTIGVPTPSSTLPAVAQATTSPSAAPSTTAPPVPGCLATDVLVRVTTSQAQYTVGQTVYFTSTFTNTSSHPCELPPCDEGFNVADASGHVVYVGSAGTCPMQPPFVFAAGATTSLGPRQIVTGNHMSPGAYTLMDRWGQSRGTTTFTLVASSGSTPTPTPTATATPLLP